MPDVSLNFTRAALGTPAYGDLLVADGDLRMTSDTQQGAAYGAEPIEQAVAQRIRTLLGEWFLDTQLGVPYYQEALGRKEPPENFERALRQVVLETPGVTALLSWRVEAKPAERRLNVAFRAQTSTGQIVWSGNLSPQGA